MAVNLNGQQFSEKELQKLVDAGMLGVAYKNDPASTTLQAPALHGPLQGNANQFGIFSTAGVRPERFSTLLRPRSFVSILGVDRSEYHQEMLEILTGQTAAPAITNATGFCGNPPIVGNLKVCRQNIFWGNFYGKTELNALALTGLLRNRADVPAVILNQGVVGHPLIPDIVFRMTDTRSVAQHEWYRLGVEMERALELVLVRGLYTGNASNTYYGWFNEFDGLDRWIRTGYTDAAPPSLACPSVDSSIVSFNAAVTSTIGGGDGRNIVQAAHDLFWGLRDLADSVGMPGVEWAWVMRKEMFRAVVEQWACDYATYRCNSTNAGLPFNRDVENTNGLRLEMMNGQYLLLDGIPVPVVFSEGINMPAIANATYEADMYLVPVSWNGMKLLRLEYFPMDNPYIQELSGFVDADSRTVINNGMYIVGVRDTGLCLEHHFQARFRLIMETPFLAGRIDNVNFTYRAPSREAIPGTSLYQDGGATYRV